MQHMLQPGCTLVVSTRPQFKQHTGVPIQQHLPIQSIHWKFAKFWKETKESQLLSNLWIKDFIEIIFTSFFIAFIWIRTEHLSFRSSETQKNDIQIQTRCFWRFESNIGSFIKQDSINFMKLFVGKSNFSFANGDNCFLQQAPCRYFQTLINYFT